MGRRPLKNPEAGAQGSTLQKDEILKDIVTRMAAGTWAPYRSVRELALELDVTLSNAERYVADAARLLRLSWGAEEAKAAIIERISQIGRAAELRTEEVVTPKGDVVEIRKPDHRSALRAAEMLSNIVGLTGSAQAEVTIKFQQMSDRELWAEAERYGRELNQGITHDTTGESVPLTLPAAFDGDDASDAAALDRLSPKVRGGQ